MGKYERLGQHLSKLGADHWVATFAEIESIVGFRLPPSARSHAAWWSNHPSHSCASAWLTTGWRSEQLDFGAEKITFRRVGNQPLHITSQSGSNQAGIEEVAQPWDKADAIECRLGMTWTPIGRVLAGNKDRLIFPLVERAPAIYRFWIRTASGDALYVGETENLARRFQNYRNPGSSQQTSLRINAKLREALTNGAEISVAVVTAGAWIERRGKREFADLSLKALRCLFEDAALAHWGAQEIQSLNRSAI